MNTILKKNTVRMISRTKKRFFSLLAIVFIGVAFFVGVYDTAQIMADSVDAYNDQYYLKDITIYSNYGFDEDDLSSIRSTVGVQAAEGAYFADVVAASGEKSYITRIHSYDPDRQINRFVLKEGRMPENEHEAVAEAGNGMFANFAIGETVTFTQPDSMNVSSVQIVGLVDTPLYVNEVKENSTLQNRPLDTYIYVLNSAFSIDYYTEVNVLTVNGQSLASFSDAYVNDSNAVKEQLQATAAAHQNDRLDKIKQEAQDQYNEGLQEYLANKQLFEQEIQAGEDRLKAAQAEVDNGRIQLTQAKQELDANQKLLNDQKNEKLNEIASGLGQLIAGRETLWQNKVAFAQQRSSLKEGVNALPQIRDGISQLDTAIAQLETYQKMEKYMDTSLTVLDQLIPLWEQLNTLLDQYDNDTTLADLLKDLDENNPDLAALIRSLNLPEDVSWNTIKQKSKEAYEEAVKTREDLLNSKQQILDLESTLGVDSVEEALEKLQSQKSDLENQAAQIEDGMQQVLAGMDALDAADQQINEQEKLLFAGLTTLLDQTGSAQDQIDAGLNVITQKQSELEKAQAEIDAGWKSLQEQKANGQDQLNQAKYKLDEAQKEIDSLETGAWTILTREQHYSSVTFKGVINQMKAIGSIFPLFFIMVAAIVCLTTMQRLVEEERSEIGTLRALGFTPFVCAQKYLIYALLATVIGAVAGSIFGLLVFPTIIYNAWKMMYILPKEVLRVPWKLLFETWGVFILIMLGSTWQALYGILKEVPASLQRPKAPKTGRKILLERIPFLWKRLSFSWKVTWRNIARYRYRFFMTVIGIAGCTALLITGYGIRDSIAVMVSRQYEDILNHDGTVTFVSGTTLSEARSLQEKISSRTDVKDSVLGTLYRSQVTELGDENETVSVIVMNDESDLEKAYSLTLYGTDTKAELGDGVLIDEKLAENTGLKIGDEMHMQTNGEQDMTVKISGIVDMYVSHYVFMSAGYYEKTAAEPVRTHTAFIQAADGMLATSDMQKAFADWPETESMEFYDASYSNYSTIVKQLRLIVLVLILSSMALAFVVLGNLMNVNVAERQREIATLKVLGFRQKEVQNYIFKESMILTMIGALVGIPVGHWLHSKIMRTVEMAYVMFGRGISWQVDCIAFGYTVLFSILVDLSFHKRLRDIEMVESLKSVE